MKARYSVVWLRTADDQLAEAWLNAADREQFRAAADALQTALSQMPGQVGEEVAPGKRVVQVGSLIALFTVSDDDRMVTVLRIKDRSAGK
jgi:hypothetical protein